MNMSDVNANPLNILFKARNQAVDSIFYDVSSLTFDEWLDLAPWVDKKGRIIVVSPSGAVDENGRARKIRHYASALEFLMGEDWKQQRVGAIAVAGVGSSVIGTAALARNIADIYNEDVAGIVSGYGMSDVVLEGLGGWSFYGRQDQFRYLMQAALEDVAALVASSFAKGPDSDGTGIRKYLRNFFDAPLDAYVPSNPDVSALRDILVERYRQQDKDKKLWLLVGHSKGNLLISSALNSMSYALKHAEDPKPFNNLVVVTLGAVVDIPDDLIKRDNQHQYLGTFDGLGWMNSRAIFGDIARKESVPGVWHSLNSKMPGHMDIKSLLKDKVRPLPMPPPASTDGAVPVFEERRNRVAAALKAMANRN